MFIRRAVFPLFLGLWACGDDGDGPTAVDPRAAAADSMLAAADSILAAADSMRAAADSILATGDGVLRPDGELRPWDLSAIVSIETVRTMAEGMPLYMRTEFVNGELADLEMRFVAVVDDFLPPMPVILVEASDPVLIQLGGIARGMSGSPVFSEEGTWGAIAYGFRDQDSPPYYFFATPIEWVIGERSTVPVAKPAATWGGARITPLETPLVSTGLHGGHPRGSVLSAAASASLTRERQESFEAGRPLAVALLLGEITAAAVGTISYADGDRIYGFGHPMDQSGTVELPIIEARVLGEISNLSAPFKYSSLNPTVRGILTEDRLPAVRGVLGGGPVLVPVRSVYTLPSGARVEVQHRMPAEVDQIDLLPDAAFAPLYNRLDNEGNHSLRVFQDISFVGTDERLTRSRLHAEPEGRVFFLIESAWGDLSDVLFQLLGRNDYPLQVQEVEIRVEVISEPLFATLVEVDADTVASPGATVTVTSSLRVGRRMDREEVEVDLELPDSLPAGIYLLEVGSAAALGPDFDPFFDGLGFLGGETEEPLEDVFARLNGEDENTKLKLRLTYLTPLLEWEEGGPPPDLDFGDGDDFPAEGLPPAPISTQEDVDLFLEGVRATQVQVVGAAP